MRRLITLAAAAAFLAAPAFAAKVTVEFSNEDGAASWVFDQEAGMATAPDGTEGAYTFDPESLKLCGTAPDGMEVCVTFDSVEETPEVGFSTGYTLDDGSTGTATITAVE